MKLAMTSLVLVLNLFTLSAGAGPCGCDPVPTSKKYLGEARKKHVIGYSIDWSCTYQCRSSEGAATPVTGTYHKYFVGAENGLEGICEGMVYRAHYNSALQRDIYMYTGENFTIDPAKSKSAELKQWAKTQACD